MNNIQQSDKDMNMLAQSFNRISVSQCASAAVGKYACVVALYASTGMSMREAHRKLVENIPAAI